MSSRFFTDTLPITDISLHRLLDNPHQRIQERYRKFKDMLKNLSSRVKHPPHTNGTIEARLNTCPSPMPPPRVNGDTCLEQRRIKHGPVIGNKKSLQQSDRGLRNNDPLHSNHGKLQCCVG
jgi:hypothetical protein